MYSQRKKSICYISAAVFLIFISGLNLYGNTAAGKNEVRKEQKAFLNKLPETGRKVEHPARAVIIKDLRWIDTAVESLDQNRAEWMIIVMILISAPWLFYLLFIGKNRLFKFVKIKGKLFFAFSGLILGLILSGFYFFNCAVIIKKSPFDSYIYAAFASFVTLFFSIVYMLSIGLSLQRSFKALREKTKQARPAEVASQETVEGKRQETLPDGYEIHF